MVSRLVNTVVLALITLLVVACDRPPGVDELQAEIIALLEREFVPGLFEVSAIRRMGSAPSRDIGTGDQRLTVYFNAELRFRKDFDLTAWDGPNAASLAFLLGATEKGMVGIQPGGNRQDDRLRIHGSRLYALRQGGLATTDGGDANAGQDSKEIRIAASAFKNRRAHQPSHPALRRCGTGGYRQ